MAVVSIVVTALLVERLAERGLRSEITRNLDAELEIRDAIANHGIQFQGWNGIEDTVIELARRHDERIVVATLTGEVLVDTAVEIGGAAAPLPSQSSVIDPTDSLINYGRLDASLLQSALEMVWLRECFDQADVPYQLGRDETDGLDVPRPDRSLTPAESDIATSCLKGRGVGDGEFYLHRDFTLDTAGRDPEQEHLDVEPVRLFIGYGDDSNDPLATSLRSNTFWVAIGIVIAAAAISAVAISRRLTRRLDAVTRAADRVRSGDLDSRVQVGGIDEIARLGDSINSLAASLHAEHQARKTLTNDVAHELRSPLANLTGYLEGIEDGLIDADRATIASLQEEANLIATLVQDLQQLSEAESGSLNLEPVDVADLVHRAVVAHQPAADAAGVVLSGDPAPGRIGLLDPERIRQILNNLITNAIRHTPPAGSVSVSVAQTHGATVVTVKDTGEGISAHHLPHIFDRFYRADHSRSRSTGGIGLGLAISRELAHAHGGSLTASSTFGVGSTLTLRIPRLDP
ncbi:sensor histidine kinase [Candidatus Poriferisodalis sp.]|uniref:sensor histidine kinase n=1 Tax=Candidatus Poriferisodalis sp. TaxID=3101277 RepID=UPI003B5A5A9B